jgi:zinc protease
LIYKDYKTPKKMKTIGDYKHNLVEAVFTSMNSRLENSLIQDTTLYLWVFLSWRDLSRSKAYQSFAIVQEDKQLSGLKFWLLKMKEQRNLVLPS